MNGDAYIVSSVSRSGSSMMMRCLTEGGIPGQFDTNQEALNFYFGDDGYQPNGYGFYAWETDFRRPDLYTVGEGKVFKIPFRELPYLVSGQYRMVFMLRDPEEIRASMYQFMNDIWDEDNIVTLYDLVVPAMLQTVLDRGDFHITTLNYADVVSDPATAFQTLADNGWPIDVATAASFVDPSLQRFKLESNG